MEAFLIPEKHHKAAASLLEKLAKAKDVGMPAILLATEEEIAALKAAQRFIIPDSHL